MRTDDVTGDRGVGRPGPEKPDAPAADKTSRGILLDFDHTLFDTDRFFWVDLKTAFAGFGFPDAAWEGAYESIWSTGYSLAKHLDELERRGVIRDPEVKRTMLGMLETAFSDLRHYVFPDVLGFLDGARRRGFDLILFSFGDPAWQSYKVNASGLAPLFRKVVYTVMQQGKPELLDDLGSRYAELHAIDNNPTDLDSMKARRPDLKTHLICRVDPASVEASGLRPGDRFREAIRYLAIPARFPHHRCGSLDEVCL